MRSRPHCCSAKIRQQQGIVVVIVLLLLVTIGASLFATSLTRATFDLSNQSQTAAGLAQAKEALIGWSAARPARPGALPCPDLITNIPSASPPPPQNIPNDGIADLLSGSDCPSYIGRLPWRTLGLPDTRDGSGERLWYAVSSSFRNNTSAPPINSDTTGQLTVIAQAAANNVIAVVFAPGSPLGTQNRNAAGQNLLANYLEGENADGNSTYSSALPNGIFNDQLLSISHDDLFSVVEKRVAREVRQVLRDYYATSDADITKRFYPYAADLGDAAGICKEGKKEGFLPLAASTTAACSCTGSSCTCQGPGTYTFPLLSAVSTTGSCSNGFLGLGPCSCSGAGTCTGPDSVTSSDSFNSATGACTVTSGNCSCSGIGTCSKVSCSHPNPGLTGLPTWFTANEWERFIYYRIGDACTYPNKGCDTGSLLSAGSVSNIHALVISAGKAIVNSPHAVSKGAAQSRPSSNLNDYLDSIENMNGDGAYDPAGAPRSASYNDITTLIAP